MNRNLSVFRHAFFWKFLILISLLLSAVTGFTQTNLLTNGDFENKTSGWTVWGATLSTTTDAHSGSLAALVSNRKNPWDALVRDLSKVLVNGETYTLSAWVKIPKPAVNFRATLQLKTDGGETYNGLLWTNSPVIGSYAYYSQTFTMNWTGNLVSANLYFENEAVGGVYSDYLIDDVQLVKVPQVPDVIQQGPGWKDIKSSMLIGGCVNEGIKNYWNNAAARAQVLKDCNAVTVQCYPGWGRWDETRRHMYHVEDFSTQVQEMKKQKMTVTAHMLLGWDQYFPAWYKNNDFPADTLEAIMQSWLKGIIQYKGNDTLVDVWNVVNEAISWNGKGGYWPDNNPDHLNACEMQRMGYEPDASGLSGIQKPNAQHPVYIRKAFEYARTLTKKKLELRDSGFEFPTDSKYNAFYELAVHLKKMNAPVDVIGFQTHIDLEKTYDWEGYVNNIRRYVDLGYQVNIPEVDIGDVAKSWSSQKAELQKAQYYRLVTSAIKGGASEMQTWGFTDDGWRTGQKAFPYTSNFEAKPAYSGIKDALTDMSAMLYWEMDGPVNNRVPDVMRNNNFGTPSGMDASSVVGGIQKKAMKFNGTSSYITSEKLSGPLSGDLTFSCFIKTATTKTSVIADLTGEENLGLQIRISDKGTIYLCIKEAGWTTGMLDHTVVNDNAWHFIAVRREGSIYRLYVDSASASVSGEVAVLECTRLMLGASHDGTSFFEGIIDEVKLYDTAIEEASFSRSITPWTPYKLTVTKSGMLMRLNWVDESTNEQGFIVERKTKDTDWQQVARVSAINYTDTAKLYNTEYSYRIRAYNSMAESSPSNIVSVTSPLDPKTGISDQLPGSVCLVYPNPVQDQFTLVSPEDSAMKLFDAQGKLMLSKKNCAARESIDMTRFPRGIYLLQTFADTRSETIKLVKN